MLSTYTLEAFIRYSSLKEITLPSWCKLRFSVISVFTRILHRKLKTALAGYPEFDYSRKPAVLELLGPLWH